MLTPYLCPTRLLPPQILLSTSSDRSIFAHYIVNDPRKHPVFDAYEDLGDKLGLGGVKTTLHSGHYLGFGVSTSSK